VFERLVKAGFSQRRKQLRKLLPEGVDWEGFAEKEGIGRQARAEELSPLQWIALANAAGRGDDGADGPDGDGGFGPAQRVHEERFDVVDGEDRVVGNATRHEVHTRGLMHRAVHIFVFNKKGELFLQKRSRWKDSHPGKWDSSSSGHVDSGQGYEQTAARELEEELGVEAEVRLLAKIEACARTGNEFVHLYRAEHEGPFRLARAEIECGEFFPVETIRRWMGRRPQDFATGLIECFERACG
jgi:16S rRNA (adenine1518-N6/adenine1519-N6)-dimethyltransferase